MSVPSWITKLYKRISPKDAERRRNPQATVNMPSSSSSSFYHNELGRALSEQSFGLARYEITRQNSVHEATALVTLLEGTNIKVFLNISGYRSEGGQTYESIEELLQSISPMYVQRREEAIIAKLQGLQ